MDAKRALIEERDKSKVALLQLMQTYNRHDDQVFFIVEGKDDVAFYMAMLQRYPKISDRSSIIVAGNRKNVIRTHDELNWKRYSKKRVFFFVDRDLSDFTKEYTPKSKNIFVTDGYSIENYIFTKELLSKSLRIFFDTRKINEEDEELIKSLFDAAAREFEKLFTPIMGWIILWKRDKNACELDNLKKIYDIKNCVFLPKEAVKDNEKLAKLIHGQCRVAYRERATELLKITEEIKKCGNFIMILRGKYLRDFFVLFFNSIPDLYDGTLGGKLKSNISIGSSNSIQTFSGYIKTPKTIDAFLSRIK